MFNIRKTDSIPPWEERSSKKKVTLAGDNKGKVFEEVLKKGDKDEDQEQNPKHLKVKSDSQVNTDFEIVETYTEGEEGFYATKGAQSGADPDLAPLKTLPKNIKNESEIALLQSSEKEISQLRAGLKEKIEPRTYPKEVSEMAAIPQYTAVIPEPNVRVEQKGELPPPPRTVALQQVIEKIVQQLYTVREEGKTETVIELKNTQLGEGARVVVTTLDATPNKLNVSFERLSHEGQVLLDQNRDGFKAAMEQKGFVVINLIVTTQDVPRTAPFDPSQLAKHQERESGQNPQKQKQQDEEQS